MEGALIAVIALSWVTFVVFALIATMFFRGSWLVLLAGSAAFDPAKEEPCRALGRHMGIVLMVASALMVTLAAFLGGELGYNARLVAAASMANNIAFVAFVAILIWFFIVERSDDHDRPIKGHVRASRHAGLEHLHAATIVFVVIVLAIVGSVGFFAANL